MRKISPIASIVTLMVIGWTVKVKTAKIVSNVIEVESNTTSDKWCIWEYMADNSMAKIPQSKNRSYDLVNHYDPGLNFCNEKPSQDKIDVSGKIVLIKYSTNCSADRQINYFRNKSITALIMTVKCDIKFREDINITEKIAVNSGFTIAFITNQTLQQLISSGPKRLKLWKLTVDHKPNYGMFSAFWIIAVFTVTVGALWSGYTRHKIFDSNHSSAERTTPSKITLFKEESFLELSPLEVICLVIVMAVVLILLYFFWNYLIFLQLFIFFMASIISVFVCIEPLIAKMLSERCRKSGFKICDSDIPFYYLPLLVITLLVALFWFITRHHSFSWLTQDILGVFICIFAIKSLRLPSLMIILVLLWLLFIYDIFMVFVTPYLTKGESVMEKVATGGDSGLCITNKEKIPFLFRLPYRLFSSDPSITVCFPDADSMLGFGDVVVPAILVAYCYAFDLIFKIKFRIYFVLSIVGYGLGLIATFISLFMTELAQPALLFLVPFTSIPVVLVGLCRNDLNRLWIGPEKHSYNQTVGSHHDIQTIDEKPSTEAKTS